MLFLLFLNARQGSFEYQFLQRLLWPDWKWNPNLWFQLETFYVLDLQDASRYVKIRTVLLSTKISQWNTGKIVFRNYFDFKRFASLQDAFAEFCVWKKCMFEEPCFRLKCCILIVKQQHIVTAKAAFTDHAYLRCRNTFIIWLHAFCLFLHFHWKRYLAHFRLKIRVNGISRLSLNISYP